MTNTVKKRLAYLLRAAVIDAQRAEKLPGFKLDMQVYAQNTKKVCHVCMAGAHAILGLGASKIFNKWSYEEWKVASAVNSMRHGDFKEAAEELDPTYDTPKHRSDPQVARAKAYILEGFDPVKLRAPWEAYLKAACALLGEAA